MKKIVLFSLFAVILASCGRNGNDGLLSTWKIVKLPVNSSNWQPVMSNDGLYVDYYIAVFSNVPEITQNIYKDGLVLCYIDHGDSRQILPTVIPYYDDSGNEFITWTQTIDFIYWVGGVQINLTNSDFVYGSGQPKSMNFVLQILY